MYSGERINTFARACDGRCSNLHGNRFNMCLFNRYSINGIDITINLFIYNAWMQYLIPCGNDNEKVNGVNTPHATQN